MPWRARDRYEKGSLVLALRQRAGQPVWLPGRVMFSHKEGDELFVVVRLLHPQLLDDPTSGEPTACVGVVCCHERGDIKVADAITMLGVLGGA